MPDGQALRAVLPVLRDDQFFAVHYFANGNKANGSIGLLAGPARSLTIPNLVSLTSASAATLDF